MTSTGWLGHEQYVPAHRRPRRYAPAHLCTSPAPLPPTPARRAALLVAVPALAGLAAAAPGAGGAPATPAAPGAVSLGRVALASATARTYTVRAGDTLAAIATRFGTTVAELAARNHLSDPNRISIGQVLVVAGPATGGAPVARRPTRPAAVGGSYTVRAGDTLGAIAARFGTTVGRLAATNRIADPNRIVVGQVIHLPGGPRVARATAAAGPRATPVAPRPAGVSGRYTVRAGDTLGAIAARFGTTVGRLAAFNHVADPNQIVVGQVIRIPGRGVVTSSSTATPTGAASPNAGGTTTGASTTGASTTGASESAQAAVAVRTALAQVGKPYEWAGAGPDSFDCSGLVMYAWEAAGVFLPHYTVSQMDDTTRIRASQLEPGDIVFYDTPSGGQPGHEAMYIGGGQVVSANNVGTDVQTQSITYDGPPVAFGRVG